MKILGVCTYCMLKGNAENLTPLYERNKPDFIRRYCPHCLPIIKKSADQFNERAINNGHLPLFWFGAKGEHIKKDPQ
jgi:hypothetical protein